MHKFTMIRGAVLHRVTTPEPFLGNVVVKDGRIAAVGGAELDAPAAAAVIDAAGLHLVPGFIDAHTHVGIGGEGLGPRFNDGNETPDPVQPHIRALDAVWHDDPGFAEILAAGITTVFVCPGSVNVFGGTGVALKTREGGVDSRVVPGTAAMKMALGENVKRVHHVSDRYPKTRMGIAAIARMWLYGARKFVEGGEQGISDFEREFRLAALAPLVKRQIRARIHAHRADDILTAVRIGAEFDLDIAIEHCTEGFLVKDVLAEKGIPAVVGPHLGGRSKPETARRNTGNAAALDEAGVKIAIQTDAGSGVQYLPLHAAALVRDGMREDRALRAITLNAAEILGAGDRIGSIDPGKDADLVLMDGPPLDWRSKVRMVMIEGTIAHRDPKFANRLAALTAPPPR